jgi:hypothetical protein
MPDSETGTPFEVACDESGAEGEHLIGANTDVFAHGSVHLASDAAAASVQEVRDRVRSPATEYKANHLLREKQRAVLEWILGPDGPLLGCAHVHLTDKTAHVVDRLVAVLCDGAAADSAAAGLLAAGRAQPTRSWDLFLEAANDLLRSRDLLLAPTPVDTFFLALDDLRRSAWPVPAGTSETLTALAAGRGRAEAYRDSVAPAPPVVPILEPFFPALLRTIAYWTDRCGGPVTVVHDETNALTPERIDYLWERAGAGLAGIDRVDSAHDPRVQLADFLAGVARKIASEALGGRADPALVGLIRPYVDATSVWGDPTSAALLGLTAAEGAVSR